MDTRKQHWQKTDVPNLFKLADSGTYYVRVKIAKMPTAKAWKPPP